MSAAPKRALKVEGPYYDCPHCGWCWWPHYDGIRTCEVCKKEMLVE